MIYELLRRSLCSRVPLMPLNPPKSKETKYMNSILLFIVLRRTMGSRLKTFFIITWKLTLETELLKMDCTQCFIIPKETENYNIRHLYLLSFSVKLFTVLNRVESDIHHYPVMSDCKRSTVFQISWLPFSGSSLVAYSLDKNVIER